jgi:hypothetical protein
MQNKIRLVFKVLLKTFYGLLGLIAILGVILLFSNVSPEQDLVWNENTSVSRNLDSEFYTTKFDSLFEEFGQLKVLPKGYEVQALLALSKYPELKDVKISFEFVPIVAPLESNFDIPTLLRRGELRTYRILISNDITTMFKNVLFDKMPFDAQVAMLTHELGHTLYYHQLNLFQIGRWGINYLASKDFQKRHESDTDRMVIYRGLGWQLYESADFFENSFEEMVEKGIINKDFLNQESNYLSKDEILEEMTKIPGYETIMHEL